MNYVVPLQIGARDVAFPFLNNFSFWMTVAGALLVMASLFVGEFARTGWLAYPPLSGLQYSPDVGVDYYIWALQIAGVGTLLSGVNLLATIIKMRAPGMTLMKMPVFTWTALCTNVLIVAAFPVLTAVLALLSLDRYVGTQLLHERHGRQRHDVREPDLDLGSPRGVHPDPAAASACSRRSSPTFSGKKLFGYSSMVYATVVDRRSCRSSCGCTTSSRWARARASTAFFGITTIDHLDPDRREDLQLAVHDVSRPHPLPARRRCGRSRFMVTFVIGGMTGVLLAVPRRGLRAAQQPVPDRALPQRDHRRRAVRPVWPAINVLVPEGVRLQAGPVLGQGLVLVLADRLLAGVHAAVRAGPARHDAPHEPL